MSTKTTPKLTAGKDCWVTTRYTTGPCLVRVLKASPAGRIVHLQALDCFAAAGDGFCCGDTRPFAVADVTVIEAV